MEKPDLSAMVLLGFRKTFVSILNHDKIILLLKLQDLGISKYTLSWFTSYLTNRHQVMRINSTLSSSLRLNSGVTSMTLNRMHDCPTAMNDLNSDLL